jgi:hypothetical protein
MPNVFELGIFGKTFNEGKLKELKLMKNLHMPICLILKFNLIGNSMKEFPLARTIRDMLKELKSYYP